MPVYHPAQCLYTTPLSACLPQVTAELERTIGANQSTAAVQVQDSQTSASEALTKQQSRMQTQIDQLKKDVTLAEDLTESIRHEVSVQSDRKSFSSEIMSEYACDRPRMWGAIDWWKLSAFHKFACD